MTAAERQAADLTALVYFLARVIKSRWGVTVPEVLADYQHNAEGEQALATYERMPKEVRDKH